MYWTDWGRAAKIERSGMDGSERQVLVCDDVVWPNSVTVDYESEKLFWTDAGLQHIETSRLDGTGRTVQSHFLSLYHHHRHHHHHHRDTLS